MIFLSFRSRYKRVASHTLRIGVFSPYNRIRTVSWTYSIQENFDSCPNRDEASAYREDTRRAVETFNQVIIQLENLESVMDDMLNDYADMQVCQVQYLQGFT